MSIHTLVEKISFIWCFRFLASLMSRLPLRLLAGGEAVAFAIHLQDVDVMSETVEQCAGEPLGSEYRYERGSTIVTTNLPFDEWTSFVTGASLTARPPAAR